jgi:hypothetical protein
MRLLAQHSAGFDPSTPWKEQDCSLRGASRLFDQIATRPEAMLLDVMRFLGVRADRRYIDPDAKNPVNPTAATRIPAEQRQYLQELLADDIRKARERFGVGWE